MYVTPNFKTKKALKLAIKEGKEVYIFQPNDLFNNPLSDGRHTIEGPHYPQPHTWYAIVEVKDKRVIRVIS